MSDAGNDWEIEFALIRGVLPGAWESILGDGLAFVSDPRGPRPWKVIVLPPDDDDKHWRVYDRTLWRFGRGTGCWSWVQVEFPGVIEALRDPGLRARLGVGEAEPLT